MRKKSEMKTTKFLTAIGVAALSVGMLAGCGQSGAFTMDGPDSFQGETTGETTGETGEAVAGLQDYEGFYIRTTTEQIEDYEVTATYGYLLNGDGTGVVYGQDTAMITWNETEIHSAGSTESFTIEAGKLTVNDTSYDKIDGVFIAPAAYDIDVNNIDNGIYYASIDKSGISEADGKVTVRTEIYTEDSYDIVDVNRMTDGDVIYINGQLMTVNSVDKTDSGIIIINGGIEEMGAALRAEEESNCYVYAGMDYERSYTLCGVAELALSDDAKLIDNSDPSEVKETTGSDVASALIKLVENYSLNCYNCKIVVEDGAIVEINRIYIP